MAVAIRPGTACRLASDPAQRPPLVRGEPVRERPFVSSAFSRAHCCGLSRSRDAGLFDHSDWAPPSCQARCHRRTDRNAAREIEDLLGGPGFAQLSTDDSGLDPPVVCVLAASPGPYHR